VTLRSDVAEDVKHWAIWSLSYRLSDDRPLCGTGGEQGSPLPQARMCGPCESLLQLLEHDIHRGRWAKAEALGGGEIDAAIRAIVRERLAEVGW
jgi:hypothetical protein